MEVHPPHHPLHTWRDFFIHIATIVVGLLIAIGLEQTVEHLHDRHTVHVARTNIRAELEHNHQAAAFNIGALQKDIDLGSANVTTLHRIMKDPKNFHGSLEFSLNFRTLDTAAWITSRDTGALAHMPYSEVERLAGLYEDQRFISEQMNTVFERQTLALAPVFAMEGDDLSQIPTADMQSMLHETASTLILLRTLQQITRGLDARYVELLKNPE